MDNIELNKISHIRNGVGLDANFFNTLIDAINESKEKIYNLEHPEAIELDDTVEEDPTDILPTYDQPFMYTPVDIENMTNDECEQLKCGDIVIKSDGTGKHAYIVSFRSTTGMCITYTDASCVETISYDLIDGVWTFNSKDITSILPTEEV